MKITIDSTTIKFEASGLTFLKLKTELTKRLGPLVMSRSDTIQIPASSLVLIEDLIPIGTPGYEAVLTLKRNFDLHQQARTKANKIIENGDTKDVTQAWMQVLDPPQATAVAAMVLPDLIGLCLFDEQGSGKTVMAIAAFDILKERGSIDAMIVICPKSMVSEWPKDINKFLPGKYSVTETQGNRRQKYESALRDFDVLVTNFEGIEPMLSTLLASAEVNRFLLVVDESFYLKNSETVRASKTERLRSRCARCFVLCGTPAPNSAHDLVNQFNLADLGFTFGGFSRSTDPTRDWDRITRLVDERGLFIRRLKGGVLKHVPEKNFHLIRVELQGKQALMYEKAKNELELVLRTLTNEAFRKSLATYFQRRSVLLQICSSPGAVDPTFNEEPVKFHVLDKLLSELISEGRKVIIWSFFKRSIDDMEARYKKYKPVRVDGSVEANKRRDAVTQFQTDPQVKVFIGNPAAAGAGITLHASYDAIYFSYSNQAAHYLQSLDRIHRRGQISKEVNYYLLVCKHTVEETEIVRLRGKEIRQNGLLGDHVAWPTNLDEALKELSDHG